MIAEELKWTDAQMERLKATLEATGPREGIFGRWYVDYYSPPQGNIYGEPFAWSERVPKPDKQILGGF